jgi:hypothetical protein
MMRASADDVCSLPPDELEARRRSIRAEILPFVARKLELPDGFACEFDSRLKAKLEDLVLLERDCCSSLDWKVLDLPGGGVRLEVRGDGAAALARSVLGGCALGRLAKAGSAGFAGAFFLCCVLPKVALAAVGGGALGASLARLDHPTTIALLGLAFAGITWKLLRRDPLAR